MKRKIGKLENKIIIQGGENINAQVNTLKDNEILLYKFRNGYYKLYNYGPEPEE